MADDRPVIGLTHKTSIKVVVQATAGDSANGMSAALSKIKKIHQDYLDAGVSAAEISLRVVIHGNAADHVLTDDAWNKRKSSTNGNPSTPLINDLVAKGVELELCNSRRLRNGWDKSEIHPAVALVGNAYLRLADLQRHGYAYIRL